MPANGSIEDMEKELEELLELSHRAFVGRYAEQIDELLGLSRTEIANITPDLSDLEVYDRLVSVVKAASKNNLSQAELVERILALGDVAVRIARKTKSLAQLFDDL
jgi:hypothetical protein